MQGGFGETGDARVPLHTWMALAAGVIAASLAAIFIRLAQAEGLPSPLIAAARLGIAALMLTPLALLRHGAQLRRLALRDLLLAALAGLFLALHFLSWIQSLETTAVLISGVLVWTSPLWIALLEFLLFRQLQTRAVVLGMLLAIAGCAAIGLSARDSVADDGSALGGALLALTGALALACYLVIGRSLRRKLPLLPHIWLVYGTGGLAALAYVLLRQPLEVSYPTSGWLWLLAVALVPQLIGHSAFNYALAFLPATLVSIAGLLEPLGGGVIALLVWSEQPGTTQLFGSLLILAGVLLAIRGQATQARKSES